MHARIQAWRLGLNSLWLDVKVRLLRRLARKPRPDVLVAPTSPDRAGPHAESEFDMSDPNEMNPGRTEEPVVKADSEEEIEAALRSMQGELENLSGMLEQDSAHLAENGPQVEPAVDPADAAAAVEDLAAAAVGAGEDAGDDTVVAEEPFVADGAVADEVLDAGAVEAMTGEVAAELQATTAESQTPRVAPPAAQAPLPADPVAPSPAVPSATAAAAPRPRPQPPAERAPLPGSGLASAAHEAFDEPMPAAAARAAAQLQRRSRAVRAQAGPVESAILNLATFLEDEVSGRWEDARQALAEIVQYRDQIKQATQRIELLEREIRGMRDDIANTRREARNVQQQMQNLRDDAGRARQRADSAALDAQSAADRAISAAREIETTVNLHRDA